MKLLIKVWFFLIKIVNKIMLFFVLKSKNIKCSTKTFRGIPFILNNGEIVIEEGVVINSNYRSNPIGGNSRSSFWTKKNGKIHICKGARISNSAFVSESSIEIGKNTFIGGDCKIYDTDFHSIKLAQRLDTPDTNVKTASLNIGEGVFIGTGAIIMKGVNIGNNSVIGAGSVVVKSIPDNEIWGGNPAEFIKKIDF